MKAVYTRVSTEEQVKNGFSLQDQLRQCRTKAGSENVKEYIDDGISGEFLDRPALTRLRQDVKDGLISCIIYLDPDRLSRKLMNQLIITDEFDKRGVEPKYDFEPLEIIKKHKSCESSPLKVLLAPSNI